jgi:hypothetical protein
MSAAVTVPVVTSILSVPKSVRQYVETSNVFAFAATKFNAIAQTPAIALLHLSWIVTPACNAASETSVPLKVFCVNGSFFGRLRAQAPHFPHLR